MVSYYRSSSGAGGLAISADGSGSANPSSNHFAQAPSPRLLAYMESCHVGSWHWTLNNQTSTRPKCYGGATVPSLSDCKTFRAPGSASASWQCVVDLPNSFNKDDGIRLCVSSEGRNKKNRRRPQCLPPCFYPPPLGEACAGGSTAAPLECSDRAPARAHARLCATAPGSASAC